MKENETNSRKMKDLQRKNTDLKNQNEITEEVNRDMSEELTNLKQILEHERRLRNRFSKITFPSRIFLAPNSLIFAQK